MDLVKKWWGFILAGMAIGLGIIYFKDLNLAKYFSSNSERTLTSDQKAQVVVGQKTVSLEKQVTGVVVSWIGNTSELTYKLTDEKDDKKITLDSAKMSLFIPEAQHKTQAVLPLVKNDKNWLTAFCPQDTLTIGYDNKGDIKLVFNTGYRSCGYKGE